MTSLLNLSNEADNHMMMEMEKLRQENERLKVSLGHSGAQNNKLSYDLEESELAADALRGQVALMEEERTKASAFLEKTAAALQESERKLGALEIEKQRLERQHSQDRRDIQGHVADKEISQKRAWYEHLARLEMQRVANRQSHLVSKLTEDIVNLRIEKTQMTVKIHASKALEARLVKTERLLEKLSGPDGGNPKVASVAETEKRILALEAAHEGKIVQLTKDLDSERAKITESAVFERYRAGVQDGIAQAKGMKITEVFPDAACPTPEDLNKWITTTPVPTPSTATANL